jgi:hypothetical protein
MLMMKKEVVKENTTMHTDVVRKSPHVAPNFCGYCACRRLLYVITSLRFPLISAYDTIQ